MNVIDFQAKARPTSGRIEWYWFENEHVRLSRTLFHRILIPFAPFDSGLDYVNQPEETELCMEWLILNLDDPNALDGIEISSQKHDSLEASIYLGAAHNPVDVRVCSLTKVGASTYQVEAELNIFFEFEGVARDERFLLSADAQCAGEA